MTGSSRQRSEVWRGVRAKTSGGLIKADLKKNKRGKIVSKKKSEQASNQNNLGSLLRKKGTKMKKSEIMHPKRAKQRKPPKAPKAPKAPSKAQPKTASPKQKAKPNPAAPKAKPKKKKVRRKPGINPITQQPREKKSGLGYVAGGNINLDNVLSTRRTRKPRQSIGMM